MADVFISYAREDRDRVRPLAQALQSRGLSVWWDRALASGDDYTSVIERELAAAKVVVVVWTAVSVNSTFVRDEAGRARDLGRLAPVVLDRNVAPPLGFGQLQAEDFADWNGSASAPQVELLEESLRARIEGRAVDSAAVQSKRRRAAARIRTVSILGVIATLLVIAASVAVLTRKPAPPPQQPVAQQQDQLAQLLQLVAEGKLTGDQALQLAKLLQANTFNEAAKTADAAGADAPIAAPADASAEERTAIEQAPVPKRDAMIATARSAFEDAAAALLIDPDQRVRAAILQTRSQQTLSQGLDALWALGKEGGASAAAIWRACGSLMLATGDARAAEALENARSLNPQDKSMWRLLSYSYARDRKPREAAGAALVSEGIERAGSSDWSGAESRLGLALPLVRNKEAKGFVLSQIGDAAAAQKNWDGAEQHYRSALQVHGAVQDKAAISLDTSRLARALVMQGDRDAACETLQRAVRNGATVPEEEVSQTCAATPAATPSSTPAPAAADAKVLAKTPERTLLAPARTQASTPAPAAADAKVVAKGPERTLPAPVKTQPSTTQPATAQPVSPVRPERSRILLRSGTQLNVQPETAPAPQH